MRNNFVVFLAGILFCIGNAFAQKSLLYQFTKDNQPSSYIYGTIHVSKSHLFTLNKALPKVMEEVDSVFFEILADEQLMQQVIVQFLLTDTIATINYLPEDKVDVVKAYFIQKFGTDLFLNLRPIFPIMVAYQSMYQKDTVKPMDLYFMEQASSLNKGLGALETFMEQLEILNANSIEDQITELIDLIENEAKHIQNFNTLMDIYATQDLAKIGAYMDTVGLGMFDIETILYQRNENMTQKIMPKTAQSSTLYFVGAAHLYGDKGILSLLQQQGYQIIPIN